MAGSKHRTAPRKLVLGAGFALALSLLYACSRTSPALPIPQWVPSSPTSPPTAAVPPLTKKTGTLRVLSYNLYVYNENIEATARLIREIDADMVALQETIPPFEQHLRQELTDLYPHMEFHVGPIGNGPGILSKQPWINGRYVVSSAGYNGYWIGTFELNGKPFQLANVHLSPTPLQGFNPFKLWSAYKAAEEVRLHQMNELRASLTSDLPTILAGDFNSPPGSPTLARGEQFGYVECLGSAEQQGPTFRTSRTSGGLGFRIDHVLLSTPLRCEAAAVDQTGSSDHFPLVAVVSWAETTVSSERRRGDRL